MEDTGVSGSAGDFDFLRMDVLEEDETTGSGETMDVIFPPSLPREGLPVKSSGWLRVRVDRRTQVFSAVLLLQQLSGRVFAILGEFNFFQLFCGPNVSWQEFKDLFCVDEVSTMTNNDLLDGMRFR